MEKNPSEKENISAHIQDCIVFLAITSKEFLKSIRLSLPVNFLSSKYAAKSVELCYSYWDNFNDPPLDHFYDEVQKSVSNLDENERSLFIQYIKRIQDMRPPNLLYVLSQLSTYIQRRELEKAVINAAEFIQHNQLTEAENILYKALKAGIHRVDTGLDFLRSNVPMRASGEYQHYLMSTGIAKLDDHVGGYKRGQFIVFLGNPKGLKTWSLIHLAKTAMIHGLNVVHISHEMGEEEMEDRYDMMLGAMVSQPEPRKVEYNFYNGNEIEMAESERPSIHDWKAAIRNRQKLRRHGGRLFIKKFPMGSATMLEVDRYLHYLELTERIQIDVVINDYADIMAPIDGKKELRHQINDSYMYHKRIADERNCLVVTASQTNRNAIGNSKLTGKDFAEDIRKMANVDLGIAIARTEEDVEDGIATLHVIASRSSGMYASVLIGSVIEMGQFAVWSAPIAMKSGFEGEG